MSYIWSREQQRNHKNTDQKMVGLRGDVLITLLLGHHNWKPNRVWDCGGRLKTKRCGHVQPCAFRSHHSGPAKKQRHHMTPNPFHHIFWYIIHTTTRSTLHLHLPKFTFYKLPSCLFLSPFCWQKHGVSFLVAKGQQNVLSYYVACRTLLNNHKNIFHTLIIIRIQKYVW